MRLNNTLTRLLVAILLIAAIKMLAISIDQALTYFEPPSEDLLVKYGYDQAPKQKGTPTFADYVGGIGNLTPEEFNAARNSYLNEHLESLVSSYAGPKPKRNITEWNELKSQIEKNMTDDFNRQVPAKKVDTFTDKAGNVGHSAAIGIVKSLRLITYLGGKDNAAFLTLSRVIQMHQDAMTETEKIEAIRGTEIIESAADVGFLTELRTRLENIRMTWAIEALIVPLILLEVIFFRKIQHWDWPKLPTFQHPTWPPARRKMFWAEVPLEQARKHRKYGIRNSLIILIIYLVLSPLALWGSLNKQLWNAGVTHREFFALSDSAPLVLCQLLISVTMAVIVLWAMFTKQPKFRRIATTIFVAYFPIYFLSALIFPTAIMGQAVAQGLIQWVIFGGLWVLYFQRSERVRVTFENTVKSPRLAADVNQKDVDT